MPDRLARNNPDLTERGQEQALRVADRLSRFERIDELWVSPMRRAQETSLPVAEKLGVTPETFDWLHEIGSPPEWDGSPGEEIERILREANYRSMDEMWDGWPGEGETFRAFHDRVVTGLRQTLDTHGIHPLESEPHHLWRLDDPDKRVVVIAHGGTNAVVLGHLLGLDPVPWEWERFHQPHTSVSRLTMMRISTGWAFSLRQVGDVRHLDPDIVTV